VIFINGCRTKGGPSLQYTVGTAVSSAWTLNLGCFLPLGRYSLGGSGGHTQRGVYMSGELPP